MKNFFFLFLILIQNVFPQIIAWDKICSIDPVYSIAVDDLGYIYAGTPSGVIYSYNDGNTWTFSNPPNTPIFKLLYSDHIVFAAEIEGGKLWQTSDHGQTWSYIMNGNFSKTLSLYRSSEGYLYSGTELGKFNISTDNGIVWSTIDVGVPINTISSASNGYIYAGTQGQGLLLSTNYGVNWNRINNPNIDNYISSIAINSLDHIFVTNIMGLSYSTDNGNTWTIRPFSDNYNSVLALDSSDNILMVVNNSSTDGIFRSLNEGLTWQNYDGPGSPISVKSKGNKIFVGTEVDGGWRNDPNHPSLQDPTFFPFESIKSFCVKTNWTSSSSGGIFYNNTYSIGDTTINNQKYFKYKFKYSNLLLNHDEAAQKTYIYLPQLIDRFVYADYNVNVGDTVNLYLDGSPKDYYVSQVDTIYFLHFLRKRVTFYKQEYGYLSLTFYQGIGLTSIYWDLPMGPYSQSIRDYIYAAIIDTIYYNPYSVFIDSTSLTKDRPIDTFPFTMKIYPRIENPDFISNYFVEFNIFRDDTLFLTDSINISHNTNYAFIPYDSSSLKVNDIIKYKVVYEDTSIFLHEVSYPDTGYKSIKILPIISSLEEDDYAYSFILYDAYPNPFNPVTNIKFSIEKRDKVTLKIYDILGREKITLVNDEQPAGDYEVQFDASNLPSGIYFYQLNSGSFSETKKLILIK